MSFVTPALNCREGPTQISPLTLVGYIYAHMGGYAGNRGSFTKGPAQLHFRPAWRYHRKAWAA